MANQFNTNPYSLTTTMGSSYRNTVTAGQQTNWIGFKRIYWQGGTAAQTCVLTDGHGNTLFTFTAASGADTVFDIAFQTADFQVTTLASGTLYIYLR